MIVEHVPCNLCGSKNKSPWKTIGSWRIVCCDACRFLFLDPRPTPEEMEAILTQERVSDMYDGALDPERVDRAAIAFRLNMLKRMKDGGKLLDVGCGEGSFLSAAQQVGWSVYGIEILEGPGRAAAERLDGRVIIGDILEVDPPASPFDAITMWDSLEHMRDPTAVVRRLKSHLKSNGILIVRVPHCTSFDARVRGPKWRHWSLPLHMSHFTPRTVCRLLEQQGFAIEVVDRKISTVAWSLLGKLGLRAKGVAPAAEKREAPALMQAPSVARQSVPFRLVKWLFTGREVTVAARLK